MQPDAAHSPDRLSARWLLAITGRLIREVGALVVRSERGGDRVATFGIESALRFATSADRAAFADELTTAVAALVAKYHDATARSGQDHRLIVAVHPRHLTETAAGESAAAELKEF